MKKRRCRKSTRKVFPNANIIIDIEKRTIILYSFVSNETAILFQGAIWGMQNFDLRPITVRIRRGSRGGCVISCQMINGLLKSCFAPTVCILEDYAFSGFLHILEGAGERVMRKNARLKFHWANVCLKKDTSYDVTEIISCFADLVRMNKRFYDMMKERTGLSVECIEEFCKTGAVITAKKALSLSLIDRIIK